MSERKYAMWLSQIGGLGSRSCHALCRAAKSVDAKAADPAGILFEMPEADLRLLCQRAARSEGKAATLADRILKARAQSDPDQIEEELLSKGIMFLSPDDKQYPQRLREIPDPPYSLYYIGSLPSDSRPSLAMIGARMATPYGKKTAREFGMELASQGIQIVSGMAAGIDGIAGRAALECGASFAVLGSGVDICYPSQNRDLYEALRKSGGIVSEYPPGTAPQARLFPMRNRIISGLSDAVLVVEARKKSGTLITVDMALEQGREIFAVPGRVGDALSYGCNRLIAQGAAIATGPADILEYFYGAQDRYEERNTHGKKKEDLSPLEKAIYDELDASDAKDADYLTEMAETRLGRRCSAKETGTALIKLVLKGLVIEVGIGYYRKA